MGRYFKYLFCFIVVDFFFFSSKFVFTGPINTKEILALAGIFLFVSEWQRNKKVVVSSEFIGLLAFSFSISMMALFSVMYHSTQESQYMTYFMSMLTWLGAAYTVARCIMWVHGKVTAEILSTYIVLVALVQGIIAVIADYNAALDSFILRMIPSLSWAKSVDRLYGFGEMTTLDSGGIRFAIASVLCMFLIKIKLDKKDIRAVPFFLLAFALICVCGDMVARTTIVGTAIGLAYLGVVLFPTSVVIPKNKFKTFIWLIVVTAVIFSVASILYTTNADFHMRTRFAFEGFFSLVETGHWHTGSNARLASMYVFPDNLHTWLIGDGYFINPYDDLNYLGPLTGGYYMDTDVGYLRFIFYFGLIGLLIYVSFILYAGFVCMRKFPNNKFIMLVLTSMTFVIWLKVATDCFFILALFICAGFVRDTLMEPESVEEEIE